MANKKDDWNFSIDKQPPKKSDKTSTRVNFPSEHQKQTLTLDTSSVPRNKTRSAMAMELDANNSKDDDVFNFASPIKRGIAFVLDLFFNAGLVLVSYLIAPLVQKMIYLFLDKYKLKLIFPDPLVLKMIFIGSIIMAFFLFVVLQLAFFNHSFGKKLMRIKVRGDERFTLSIHEAFKREIIFKPLSLLLVAGLITPFISKKRKSIHDMIMHTLVIDDK